MGAQSTAGEAEQKGREVKHSAALDALVRAGFVAYGAVYLLLGWLALQLALGDRERSVSKNGALHELAEQPLGKGLLWAACAGFVALALWMALDALVERHWTSGLRVAVYAVLAFSSAKVALGKPSGKSTEGYTAELMGLPFGTWLVGAVGLGVIGYGVASVVKGVTDKYREDLDLDASTGWSGAVVTGLARTGYCSRGVAFGIIGGLFVWAALTHDPDKSGGLDQALARLLDAPLGPLLLVLVAAGLACYGAFNVTRAHYHRSS